MSILHLTHRIEVATPSVMTVTQTTDGYPAKRRRTRRRLLRAGLTRLADQGPAGMSAGGIASAAGVATGTFYNHFPTVEDFYAALAQDVVRGIEIGQTILTDIENDPAVRVAIGALQLLRMADADPAAASAFVTLVASRPDFRGRVRALISDAIIDGVEADRFDVKAGNASTDAILGAVLQSMRSVILGEATYVEAMSVASLMLRLLGVVPGQIESIIERAVWVTAEADL